MTIFLGRRLFYTVYIFSVLGVVWVGWSQSVFCWPLASASIFCILLFLFDVLQPIRLGAWLRTTATKLGHTKGTK